jgi:diguanylate cyclase (GGDEF)-like protein
MPATSSDIGALGARLRTVTMGRLVAVATISVALGTVGAPLIDPAGLPLLAAAAVAHVVLNLVVLLLPTAAAVQRVALEVTTIVDAAVISVVLVVTGGVASPFMPLLYAEAVALTLVFGWWTGVRSATLLSLGLVWALATSPPAMSETVGAAARSDPALAAILEPSTRAVLILIGLWAVTALVAALSGVTERELRRWLDDLALLRDVTHDLDPRKGVGQVCRALADTLTGPMGYRGAVVWLVEGEDEGLLRACSGAGAVGSDLLTADEAPAAHLLTSEPPVHRALTEGRPLPVRRADPRADALTQVHGQEAALVIVPLRLEGRLLGILSAEVAAGFTGPPKISGRDLRRLHLLVDEATLLLANATLQAELRDLAVTDALTGLPNHRFLQQRLGEEVERVYRRAARGEKRPLSLALFDLDHFKEVNDTYGHPTGDAVLRAVARTTSDVLRASDVACRYGGEEFAVVLVDTTGPEAIRACERIADALRAMTLEAEDGRPLGKITASFGLATTVGVGLDRPSMIAAADRALYTAKREGRDRVRHAEHLEGPASDEVSIHVAPDPARRPRSSFRP